MIATLGDFELCILVAVSRLAGDAYGLRIQSEVSKLRRHEYAVGAIYTALQRLAEKGFVESWMSEPSPVRGGRARRQYRLTASGARAVSSGRRMAARIWAHPRPGTR